MWLICLSARFNHELVFGVSIKNMNKAERLIFGESLMTHAMVLTAVTEKVESPSWSSDAGRDVLEYPGSFFVSWAHSHFATTPGARGLVVYSLCLRLSVQNNKYLTRREEFQSKDFFPFAHKLLLDNHCMVSPVWFRACSCC